MAVEDIGLADPHAIVQANAAKETYDFLGSPEGELALAQTVVYLASAPKSNAVYKAYKASMRAAKEHGSLAPPKHILNAPTRLMAEQGYGEGYEYDHDAQDAFSGQNYFPDEMERQGFSQPTGRGYEKTLSDRSPMGRVAPAQGPMMLVVILRSNFTLAVYSRRRRWGERGAKA
jgi:putative ATPase